MALRNKKSHEEAIKQRKLDEQIIQEKNKRDSDNSLGGFGMKFNAAQSAAKDVGIVFGQGFTNVVGDVAEFANDKINDGEQDTVLGRTVERSRRATQNLQNAGSQTLKSGNKGGSMGGEFVYSIATGAVKALPTVALAGGWIGGTAKAVELGRKGIAAARGVALAAEAGKVAKLSSFAGGMAGMYGLAYTQIGRAHV